MFYLPVFVDVCTKNKLHESERVERVEQSVIISTNKTFLAIF